MIQFDVHILQMGWETQPPTRDDIILALKKTNWSPFQVIPPPKETWPTQQLRQVNLPPP